MELNYRYSESTVKPSELEIGKRTVFIRKDLKEVERYDESTKESQIFWTYQEAKMTHAEFNDYSVFMSAKRAISGENDSDNIVKLVSGQANGDNNQLIIMEAIADLYDAILNKI